METMKQIAKNPMFWVAIIYLIFPTDIVPDVLPVVGNLDDLIPFILSMVTQAKISQK